jgi:hypothetical protein
MVGMRAIGMRAICNNDLGFFEKVEVMKRLRGC